MSEMRWIDANISQKFFILLIFFLFFNASLVENYKALKIEIKMLDVSNNISILIYNKFIKSICKILRKIYNVYTKWA
jgi:hypothetical protein